MSDLLVNIGAPAALLAVACGMAALDAWRDRRRDAARRAELVRALLADEQWLADLDESRAAMDRGEIEWFDPADLLEADA